VFVRSDMAHARIGGLETADACAAPGVVAVLSADDFSFPALHAFVKVHDDFGRPPLAREIVRFVGEIVAVVLAESAAQARDAADLVVVDYEPLPAVVHPEDALAEGSAIVFEAHGNNIALVATDSVNDAIFGDADVVGIADFPDNSAAAAFSMTATSSGSVSIRTTPLLTGDEMDKSLAKMSKAKYRAPGGGQ